MPRRTFNKQMALSTATRDGSTILGDISGDCRSGTMIDFECSCGEHATKRLDSAVDYGMYCKPCTNQRSHAKRVATLSTEVEQHMHSHYNLSIGKDPPLLCVGATALQLTVAPGFSKTSIRLCLVKGEQRYEVEWWDQDINKQRKTKLRTLEAAEEFQKTLPELPVNYLVSLTVEELHMLTPGALRMYKIARICTDYPTLAVPVEAYAIGSWLGDGTARCTEITSIDEATIGYWRDYATRLKLNFKRKKDSINYVVSGNGGMGNNLLLNKFRDLGLIAKHEHDPVLTKHIPDIYKYNCREVRLQIVASLLDTDGSLDRSGVSYDFVQSRAHERLFDDLREVVLSLGWSMTKNYCIKVCKYKGELKKCPAVRGLILGDDSMMDLPIKLAYKRITKKRQYRHDLQKITITPAAAPDSEEADSEELI